MSDPLYHEMILDLYRHPLNHEKLAEFDIHHKEHNPLCGDTVELFIKLGNGDTVEQVSWTGEGCAISQAFASLTTNFIKQKTKTEIEKIDPTEILEMLGLPNLNPTRLRCAMLALEAVKKSLK